MNRKPSSTIVPGRRYPTEAAALWAAGYREDPSYLAEVTVMSDNTMNSTCDDEERQWKRQGLSQKEIFQILEDRKLKEIRD
uniref:Uncharacterized protein n=1 Tax=Caenorhabditis japonica TaxID=281687 RepID=A0A8R1ITH6_CAEJA